MASGDLSVKSLGEVSETEIKIGTDIVPDEVTPELVPEREYTHDDEVRTRESVQDAVESPDEVLDRIEQTGLREGFDAHREKETDRGRTLRNLPHDASWEAPSEDAQNREPAKTTIIQTFSSGADTVSHQLDAAARAREVDFWSAYGDNPQPDGGAGAEAMGEAYYERVRQLETEGKLGKKDVLSVCDFSATGKGVQDFLEVVRRADEANGTEIAKRTKGVVMCDTERAKVLLDAETIQDKSVTIEAIDLQDPHSIKLPDNTMVAMLDGVTNHMPTHQIVQVQKRAEEPREQGDQGLRLFKQNTTIGGAEPMVGIDPDTNEPYTIQPHNWIRDGFHTANREEGDAAGHIPQTIGRLLVAQATSKHEEEPHDGTELARRELDVRGQMKDRPPGRAYNYSTRVEALIQKVTSGVREDGMVMVGGYIRDDPNLNLGLTALTRQRRVAIQDTQGKTKGYVLLSPLRYHVTESKQIRDGVGDQARITTLCDTPDKYGHILIDRASGEKASSAQRIVKETLNANDKSIDNVLLQVKHTIQFAKATHGNADEATVKQVEEYVEAYVLTPTEGEESNEGSPQLARNAELHLGLSALYRDHGMLEPARREAERAATLLPSSEAYIRVAEASMAIEDSERAPELLTEAKKALTKAEELSPTNAEIYRTGIELAQRQNDIESEVDCRLKYLNNAPGQTPKQIIENLDSLCDAMRRNYQQYEGSAATFKTVMVHNVETNTYFPVELPVALAKRIQAADTAMAARDAVQQLLNHDLDPQRSGQGMDRTVNKFTDYWEAAQIRVCDVAQASDAAIQQLMGQHPDMSRDEAADILSRFTNFSKVLEAHQGIGAAELDQTPISREFWMDRPAENCRWIFAGRLTQSDADASPGILRNPAFKNGEKVEGEDITIRVLDAERIPEPAITIGQVLDEQGIPMGNFGLSMDAFSHNVLIIGRTGMGKTTLAEEILKQLPGMNATFLAIDASAKEGLKDTMDNLNAEGIPVAYIAPGDPDSVPVSIDLLRPVGNCPLEKHIEMVVEIFKVAYDQGQPMPEILQMGLADAYAACGWDIRTYEEKSLNRLLHPIIDNPPVPTLAMVRTFVLKRAEIYTQGEASNIRPFFITRFNHLDSGVLAPFFEPRGSVSLDRSELPKVNVYANLSHIGNDETRRVVSTTITMFYNEAVRQGGLVKDRQLKNLQLIDEAANMLEGGEVSEHRAKAIGEFTKGMRLMSGYGQGRLIFNQVFDQIHEVAKSQNGGLGTFSVTDERERAGIGAPMGLDSKEQEKLNGMPKGTLMIWQDGMNKAVKVAVKMSERPSKEAVEEAKKHRPLPPLKRRSNDFKMPPTAKERQAAENIARSKGQEWLRSVANVIALNHITHTELPRSIPEDLQTKWKTLSEKDRRQAELVLETAVGDAVMLRENVIAQHYRPDLLRASVHATLQGMLDGHEPTGPGRMPSPSFIVPEVTWALNYADTTQPHRRLPPPDTNFAPPISAVPGIPPDARLRIKDVKKILRKHPLSPHADPENSNTAWFALSGSNHGRIFWRDLKGLTQQEEDIHVRRRMFVVRLGRLLRLGDPRSDRLERILGLPVIVKDQGAQALAEQKQKLEAVKNQQA